MTWLWSVMMVNRSKPTRWFCPYQVISSRSCLQGSSLPTLWSIWEAQHLMTCLLAIIDFLYFGEARVYQEHFDPFLCLAIKRSSAGRPDESIWWWTPSFWWWKRVSIENCHKFDKLTNPGSQKSSKESEGDGIKFVDRRDTAALSNIARGTTDPGFRVYNLSYLSS